MLVGTLGKALGSYGAYVCASEEMVRYLINTARSLIFSTAPPPAVAGALAALELLEERPAAVERLRSARAHLRGALAAEGFPVGESDMHIMPLIVGDERGRCASARRPSSGASSPRRSAHRRSRAGTSRLRLTVDGDARPPRSCARPR